MLENPLLVNKSEIKSEVLGEKVVNLLDKTFRIPPEFDYNVVEITKDYIARMDLLSYQLCDDKVGFPKNVLEKVLKKLSEKEINVYVKKEEPEIIERENNQYENILYLARKNYFNELNSKVLLEEISFLLKSNPENIQKIKNFINEL